MIKQALGALGSVAKAPYDITKRFFNVYTEEAHARISDLFEHEAEIGEWSRIVPPLSSRGLVGEISSLLKSITSNTVNPQDGYSEPYTDNGNIQHFVSSIFAVLTDPGPYASLAEGSWWGGEEVSVPNIIGDGSDQDLAG